MSLMHRGFWAFLLLASTACLAADEGVVTWKPMAGAARYVVRVSADGRFLAPVAEARVDAKKGSGTQRHVFKRLRRGSYQVLVEGFSGEGVLVGKAGPFPLLVGGAFTFTAHRYGLPPPHPLGPPDGQAFLRGSRILLSWTPVKEADRYSVRVMDAADPSRVLYAGETESNNFEIYDLPPRSYRFLGPGRYIWTVACVTGPSDAAALHGREASRTFEVLEEERAAALPDPAGRPRAAAVDLMPLLGRYRISTKSGNTLSEVKDVGNAVGFEARAAWFPKSFGAEIKGSVLNARKVGLSEANLSTREVMVRGGYRSGLPGLGDRHEFYAGLAIKEILQMETPSAVSDPTLWAFAWGYRLRSPMGESWALEIPIDGFIPFQINSDESAQLKGVNLLNLSGGLYVMHHLGDGFEALLGPKVSYFSNDYRQGLDETSAKMLTGVLTLGLRIPI